MENSDLVLCHSCVGHDLNFVISSCVFCLHWEEGKEENLYNLHACKLYLLSKYVFNYLKHCIQGLCTLLILSLNSVGGDPKCICENNLIAYLLQIVSMMYSS